jgi:hypothetical protein
MTNQDQWCFAFLVPDPKAEPGQTRAAMLNGARWQPRGRTIIVSFLDGDPALHQRVMDAAQIWCGPMMANLKLQFIGLNGDGDIRISFRYPGSWSAIGTTCLQVKNRARPTMNFGGLNPHSTDDQVHRVVLHEFGHALGLVHEHQNPGAKIHWNRENVIEDLRRWPNRWTLKIIDDNMFKAYKEEEATFTRLDPQSIMMYPIPSRWTRDGFSTELNADLSPLDKQFIRQMYP